ncbi:MAG: hypothetical protein DMD79_14690 [Candidatus Rokuibacteriota bacterium]|nr:MAG: hypothetical protein DMD79_14690 [Candidatus Rokubacteria bacterium]
MISLAELSPAERLLVKLAQRREIRAPLDGEDMLLEERTFRERFTRLAMSHGVHGLVLSAIVRAPLKQSLSAKVLEEFTVWFAHLRRQAIMWDMERDRLLSLLERKGLIPVVLKGGALRETIYDQPAERSLGDLDLLFPDEQVESSIATLQANGYSLPSDEVREAYRQHHFHFLLTHPVGFAVEVHWALSRPNEDFHLDSRAFLARAVERPRVSGPLLRVPSAEDMILHMASQNVEDAFARLRRVVDVDRIIASTPHLDWNYLRQAARHGEVQILTAVALRLAHLLLGTPVPRGFVESLGVSRLTRLNLALFRAVPWMITMHDDRRESAATLLCLWTTVGWRKRLRRCSMIALMREDPLDWVWQGRGEPDGRKGRLRGFASLAKLAAYQAWIYVSGIAALLTRSGRRGVRFWTEPRAPSDLL